MDKGPWNVDVNDPNLSVKGCSSASWFGWKLGDAVGSISTTLYGNGRATLQYANFNTQGKVVVYQRFQSSINAGRKRALFLLSKIELHAS